MWKLNKRKYEDTGEDTGEDIPICYGYGCKAVMSPGQYTPDLRTVRLVKRTMRQGPPQHPTTLTSLSGRHRKTFSRRSPACAPRTVRARPPAGPGAAGTC
eukprot:2113257-Prymnesium_polylepis.1